MKIAENMTDCGVAPNREYVILRPKAEGSLGRLATLALKEIPHGVRDDSFFSLSLRERVGVRALFCITLISLLLSALPARAEFPGMYVYQDFESRENRGAPSGWMGDFRDLRIDPNWTNNPSKGKSCIKFTYTAEGSRHANMIGVMWQHPANNDGSVDGGMDLTGARRVVFWARGDKGGEFVHAFTFGGILGAYPDTDKAILGDVYLGTEWREYEIDLTGLDLSYISSFFGWATGRFHNPDGMVFYVDEIRIE